MYLFKNLVLIIFLNISIVFTIFNILLYCRNNIYNTFMHGLFCLNDPEEVSQQWFCHSSGGSVYQAGVEVWDEPWSWAGGPSLAEPAGRAGVSHQEGQAACSQAPSNKQVDPVLFSSPGTRAAECSVLPPHTVSQCEHFVLTCVHVPVWASVFLFRFFIPLLWLVEAGWE